MQENDEPNKRKLKEKSRMTKSFVMGSQEKKTQLTQSANLGSATFLSMINPHESKEKLFQDALSACSGRSRDESEDEMKEFLDKSDTVFGQLYASDPFFKARIDTKVRKRQRQMKRQKIEKVQSESSEEERPALLTLASIKKQKKSDLELLYEKYTKVLGKQK